MEMDLKGIINKIKEEGVKESEQKASEIITNAQKKAEEIVEKAQTKRKNIIENAEAETDKLCRNAEMAIKQASRDTILSLKAQITRLFDEVMEQEVTDGMNKEIIKEMMIKLVDGFNKKGDMNLDILAGEKEQALLKEVIVAGFKEKTEKGINICVSPRIEKGFLIKGKKDGAYYDFTDQAVFEAFKVFLNPKIIDILNAGEADE